MNMPSLEGKRIGFGITGSHTTYHKVFPQIKRLMDEKAVVIPIVSNTVRTKDTKMGKAKDHIDTIEKLTGRRVISTIPEVEALVPQQPVDYMDIQHITW